MYGLESDLQAVLIAHPELFPRGQAWQAVPGRHAAAGGWVDILFRVNSRRYAVVEVKRGQADVRAVAQVAEYAEDLRTRYGTVDAWVVAHVIADTVRRRATESGVKVLEVIPATVAQFMARRSTRTAMRQGTRVPNDIALAELPGAVAAVLRTTAERPHFELDSWTNRTYLRYRGEDLLGVVRHGQCHIFVKPSGSSRPETHAGLVAAGFSAKAKPGKYDHPWYHARIDDAQSLRRAIAVLQADLRPNGTR